MKKTRLISTLLVISAILLLFCSCSKVASDGVNGKDGENGINGVDGENGKDGINGKDGRTPEYRAENGWVQWKYTDESDENWRNLYEYAFDLTDPSEPVPDNIPTAIISTTSRSDNYGLAGNYTMFYEKICPVGASIKLTATVNDGYNFDGWYIGNICIDKDLECSYTVENKNVTIEAKYSFYTLTTMSNSNVANVAGKFTNYYNQKISIGESVELSTTVNNGYNFEGWYINGVCVSRDLNYTYIMESQNVEIYAEYSSYQLSVIGASYNYKGDKESYFNAGTYTSYAQKNVSQGESITLTATTNDGYNFAGWYVNDVCVSSDSTYTFTMGKENLTIEATYFYYTLSTTAKRDNTKYNDGYPTFESPDLYINTVYDQEKISIGEEITVIAKDIEGYTFTCWSTKDSVLCTDKTYTFVMPSCDVSIYALYTPI